MSFIALICLVLFVVLGIIDCIQAEREKSRILKPALMPLLAVFFILCGMSYGFPGASKAEGWLVFLALICGCGGDTFLMLSEKYFAAGLGCFLVGHVLYILAGVLDITRTADRCIPGALIVLILYAAYAAVIMPRLMKDVDQKLKGAVWLYMLAILVMSFVMFLRFAWGAGKTFAAAGFIGSILFVLSDTILAFSVFCKKTKVGIMETYLLGQLFLTVGFLF